MGPEVTAALIGVGGALAASVVTYFLTNISSKKKIAACKEKYLDDKLKGIIELYQTEVKELRADMRVLTRQNELLKEEIVGLKQMLYSKSIALSVVSEEPAPTASRATRSSRRKKPKTKTTTNGET